MSAESFQRHGALGRDNMYNSTQRKAFLAQDIERVRTALQALGHYYLISPSHIRYCPYCALPAPIYIALLMYP